MIKKVNLFVYGSTRELSYWSNVPYLFAQTLEQQGYQVNRIDLSAHWSMKTGHLICRVIGRMLSVVFGQSFGFQWERTMMFRRLLRHQIRRAEQKNRDADADISLSFGFENSFADRPLLVFADWSLEYSILERQKRQPNWFERRYIDYENRMIGQAALVVPLFAEAAKFLRNRVPGANLLTLRQNLVNCVYDGSLEERRIISQKESSLKLLFIGRRQYLSGALLLLEAFQQLRVRCPQLTLDIVGLEQSDFAGLPPGVTCHGFLKKEDPKQREIYYRLLQEAKIFINPTSKWAGYSAMVEAMFFYNPVITTRYPDFVHDFGETLSFGRYCNDGDCGDLIRAVESVVNAVDYPELCRNAHDAVKDFTYDSYLRQIMDNLTQASANR